MAETSTATPTPPARRRGRETVGDMVRSLALVLVVVGFVFVFTQREGPADPVPEVGFRQQLAQTRAVASYDVLAPVGLGPLWKATSVRGQQDGPAVTWHLGFVTPSGHYAAVEQSDGSRQLSLRRIVAGSDPAGSITVRGVTWQRHEGGSPEERALVRADRSVTTLVAGDATWGELRSLAAALRGG